VFIRLGLQFQNRAATPSVYEQNCQSVSVQVHNRRQAVLPYLAQCKHSILIISSLAAPAASKQVMRGKVIAKLRKGESPCTCGTQQQDNPPPPPLSIPLHETGVYLLHSRFILIDQSNPAERSGTLPVKYH
jgi:hypothetical protein